MAPITEIDVKEDTSIVTNVIKKSKCFPKEKVKKSYMCEQCGKSFKNLESWKVHISVKHENKKLYKCRLCKKTFSYRGGLKTHQKTCQGPTDEIRWIFWGKGGTPPLCIHPDCAGKEGVKFTYASIKKHCMNVHATPENSVSS